MCIFYLKVNLFSLYLRGGIFFPFLKNICPYVACILVSVFTAFFQPHTSMKIFSDRNTPTQAKHAGLTSIPDRNRRKAMALEAEESVRQRKLMKRPGSPCGAAQIENPPAEERRIICANQFDSFGETVARTLNSLSRKQAYPLMNKLSEVLTD